VVPVVDLRRRSARFGAGFAEAVHRVLESGVVLLGDELAALERELASTFAARHAVGVASGAGALQVCLEALGVGPGDEVVVPALTAVPTASAVCAVGARPVFADVDTATATLDAERATEAITHRTRAIVPVHLYGRPADVAAVSGLGVPVVEDAAQAHGAIRSITGVAAMYSFYPTKNLGGIGDGGAVTTDDSTLAASVRRRRVHGMTEQYVHVDISQNHRMSELEAAWLRLQLPHLGADNERRRAIARHYRETAPHLCWQADHADHVFHLAVFRAGDREDARDRLAAGGVRTAVHYPLALTQQPAYRAMVTAPCPAAETWAARCVSVPCFPELTDAEVETVAGALRLVPT
jgi:dTDP-4-amino-4,6-dideoxygalactose transaminase